MSSNRDLRGRTARRFVSPSVGITLTFVALVSACSDKSAPAAGTSGTTSAVATPNAPVAPAVTPPSPATPAAPAREIAVSAQGSAPIGLTVRVKSIEMGEDATVLSISASFGGRTTSYTKLASTDTYLDDGAGNKLMLKRPDDNRDLQITSGDTMEGKLVFLGRVAPGATQLKLVINEGMDGNNTIGPGLSIPLPLKG